FVRDRRRGLPPARHLDPHVCRRRTLLHLDDSPLEHVSSAESHVGLPCPVSGLRCSLKRCGVVALNTATTGRPGVRPSSVTERGVTAVTSVKPQSTTT